MQLTPPAGLRSMAGSSTITSPPPGSDSHLSRASLGDDSMQMDAAFPSSAIHTPLKMSLPSPGNLQPLTVETQLTPTRQAEEGSLGSQPPTPTLTPRSKLERQKERDKRQRSMDGLPLSKVRESSGRCLSVFTIGLRVNWNIFFLSYNLNKTLHQQRIVHGFPVCWKWPSVHMTTFIVKHVVEHGSRIQFNFLLPLTAKSQLYCRDMWNDTESVLVPPEPGCEQTLAWHPLQEVGTVHGETGESSDAT